MEARREKQVSHDDDTYHLSLAYLCYAFEFYCIHLYIRTGTPQEVNKRWRTK